MVVTVAKGYDLGYIWKTQGKASGQHAAGGCYINAAQAGEPPGRWWGPGAQALGFAAEQVVERGAYDAVYQQRDPRTGEKLGRPPGRYVRFADHLARLRAAEPHATAERVIELEREAAQATRQAAVYTDVTISFPSRFRCCTPRSRRTRAGRGWQVTRRRWRTGPGGRRGSGRSCTWLTRRRWSTCRNGRG